MCWSCRKSAFWLNDPTVLLRSSAFIPTESMTMEEKLNAITRLVIIVFVILLVMKDRRALPVLLISLAVIILVYWTVRGLAHQREEDHDSNESHDFTRFEVRGGNGTEDPKKTPDGKINPRKPYPPTVPDDFVVKAHRGKVFNDDPRYKSVVQQFVTPEEQEVPKKTFESQRAELRRRAYVAREPTRYEKREAPDVDFDNDEPEVQEPPKAEAPVKPQRRFYALNENPTADSSEVFVVKSPKVNGAPAIRKGIRLNPRAKASWGDETRGQRKYNVDDLQFAKADRDGPAAAERAQAEKVSQRNSMFAY